MSIWKVIKTKECYVQVDILLTRKFCFFAERLWLLTTSVQKIADTVKVNSD